ncbi:hypothetical protein WJX74_010906 [Apatococcus lobatus]|uniref:Nuclear speckle splicing regulatory protein 1 N-terminal domain-containing protein n=1 Tax=Apatococcus lobatus TaxID=904363 RepID=A0AAW1R168_9CHLO
MLLGQKGVKYGLTIPKQKAQQKKPAAKGPIKAFAQDESDEEQDNSVGLQVARHAATKQSDAKVAELHKAALAEDASIFDYDGHYDTIQQQRTVPKQQEKLARRSRYIEGLLDKAKEREREQDIVYERRLAKEREVEDHLFGDKESFVTAAYKKKLEEDKKWLAEEAIREEQEKKDDVKKRGHMGDFYRNLMHNNVAFGTTAKAAAAPDSTAALQAAAAAAAASSQPHAEQAARAAQPEDAQWQAARAARERFERLQSPSAAESSGAEPANVGASGQHLAQPSAEISHDGQPASPSNSDPASLQHVEPQAPGAMPAALASELPGNGHLRTEQDAVAGESPAMVATRSQQAALPTRASDAPAGGSKRTTQDAAAAARERYLARKRKAPPGATG